MQSWWIKNNFTFDEAEKICIPFVKDADKGQRPELLEVLSDVCIRRRTDANRAKLLLHSECDIPLLTHQNISRARPKDHYERRAGNWERQDSR